MPVARLLSNLKSEAVNNLIVSVYNTIRIEVFNI
jgi:hypothetical protein